MNSLISIIVVSHNGGILLGRLLQSLTESTYTNFEVVVIDNGSTNDSIAMTTKQFQDKLRLKTFRFERNEPLTKAYNFGIRVSAGEILGLAHNDVFLSRTWINECLKVLLRDPRNGAVQGKIYATDDSRLLDSCGCVVDHHGCEHDRGQGELDTGQYDEECPIFSASGVASLFSKEAVVNAGMLDELYASGLDDLDLCWRLGLHDYKVVYAPKAVAYHLRSATWQTSEVLMERIKAEFAKTRLYVPFKNFEIESLSMNLPVVLLHLIGDLALSISHPRSVATYSKALIWFLREAGTLSRQRQLVQARIRRVPDKKLFAKTSKNCNLVRYSISVSLSKTVEHYTMRLRSRVSRIYFQLSKYR